MVDPDCLNPDCVSPAVLLFDPEQIYLQGWW